jgi:hypothetical protein
MTALFDDDNETYLVDFNSGDMGGRWHDDDDRRG